MDFKIDTSKSYTSITPICTAVDANLAEALRQKLSKMRQSGSHNYIVDLSWCPRASFESIEPLIEIEQEIYAAHQSIVFTHLPDELWKKIKDPDGEMLLNATPTIDEAIDIINMEMLERELFLEDGKAE